MSRLDLINGHTQRRRAFQAELAAIQRGEQFQYGDSGAIRFINYGDYTPEKRRDLAAKKQAQLADFDQTFITAQLSQDRAKFEKLSARRREIIAKNRLNDPLADKPGLLTMGLAELEGIVGRVRNLRDLEAAYQAAGDNPGLLRAFQLKGASLALARWGNDPHNGGFAKRLESDLAGVFENDESRRLLADLQELYADATQLASAARHIGREGVTVESLHALDNLGSLSRQAEELTWAIFAATGQTDSESGGVYAPNGMTVNVIEGTGGLFGSSQPAAMEG